MDCAEFFKQIDGKKIAMCGIGISNTPLILSFLSKGARVFACDRRERAQIGNIADRLEKAGAELKLGSDYLENLEVDIIFRTPGMNFNMPELITARENGIPVTSEMEVFFDLCNATIFAVTGSDGKTTTTTLIAKMLEAEGKKVFVGGNIGNPLLPEIENITPDDFVVVELSSFQLISMRKSPDVAVVTNVAPNHLDIHKDMDEYVHAKQNVLLHQNAFSRAVLNSDNDTTNGFMSLVRGQMMQFSMQRPVENGAWLGEDGMIYMSYRGISAPIMNKSDITILGDHNVENYLAAISAVWGYAGADSVRKVANEFAGVEHRIEFVREVGGVRYFNDSIASSPTRTIAGLKAFDQKVILLAGGYDKHIPFEPMAPHVIDKVKVLILTGPTADIIEKVVRSAEGFSSDNINIIRADNMEDAVSRATEEAKSGDCVILSPACASFDAYPNFMERGRHYKELIANL